MTLNFINKIKRKKMNNGNINNFRDMIEKSNKIKYTKKNTN